MIDNPKLRESGKRGRASLRSLTVRQKAQNAKIQENQQGGLEQTDKRTDGRNGGIHGKTIFDTLVDKEGNV